MFFENQKEIFLMIFYVRIYLSIIVFAKNKGIKYLKRKIDEVFLFSTSDCCFSWSISDLIKVNSTKRNENKIIFNENNFTFASR
jgi:hypothetical protein